MKASELRIGNYIENTDSQMASYMVVNADVIKQNEHTMYASLEPITITKEWMFKLGFEVSIVLFRKNNLLIQYCVDHFKVYLSGNFIANIQYVHQLQNLYFALTGEELTLKP